jgi:hypothetical protein
MNFRHKQSREKWERGYLFGAAYDSPCSKSFLARSLERHFSTTNTYGFTVSLLRILRKTVFLASVVTFVQSPFWLVFVTTLLVFPSLFRHNLIKRKMITTSIPMILIPFLNFLVV